MIQQISWLGNIFICLGLWYTGSKKRWAFLLSFLGETTWIIYSLKMHLWSLAFLCFVFSAIAVRNWFKWSKNEN